MDVVGLVCESEVDYARRSHRPAKAVSIEPALLRCDGELTFGLASSVHHNRELPLVFLADCSSRSLYTPRLSWLNNPLQSQALQLAC